MDQDQAINLLDSIVAREKLTRQEHENVMVALSILRELNKRFKALIVEEDARKKTDALHAIKKKVNPEIKPPDAKEPLDNVDRSEA